MQHETLTNNGQLMDHQERIEFKKMQTDLQILYTDVKEMRKSTDRLLVALIGDDITKSGGIVQRLNDHDTELDKLKKEIEQMKKDAVKQELYVRTLWLAAGVIATAIFNVFLKH